MSFFYKKLLFILSSLYVLSIYSIDKHFVIVVPSYNNEKWCIENLHSIFSQEYQNFDVIYINDASTDNTGTLVQEYIKENNLKHRCMYIENKTNQKALYNIYKAIHSCDDTDIVIIVDGDDWLAHNEVLSYLNTVYQNDEIWITYGEFKQASGRNKPSQAPFNPTQQYIRKDLPNATHLKTFYAGLFKLIASQDLIYKNQFFPITYDIAIMLPMLEMAGETHFKCISEVLYVYNDKNPLNDNIQSLTLQFFYSFFMRNFEAYKPLISFCPQSQFDTHTLVLFIESITTIEELCNKINIFKEPFLISNVILLIDHQNNHLKEHQETLLKNYTIIWYENNTNPYMPIQRVEPLYKEWYTKILEDTKSNSVIFSTDSCCIPSFFTADFFNKAPIIFYKISHTIAQKESTLTLLDTYSENQSYCPVTHPVTFMIKKPLFEKLLPEKYYINSFLSLRAATESCFASYPAMILTS